MVMPAGTWTPCLPPRTVLRSRPAPQPRMDIYLPIAALSVGVPQPAAIAPTTTLKIDTSGST